MNPTWKRVWIAILIDKAPLSPFIVFSHDRGATLVISDTILFEH
jgi:hypothetical protein